MQYLRKFNESGLIEKRNRIIELIENYLVYLKSDGMHYNVCYPEFHYSIDLNGDKIFGACADLIGTRKFGGVCDADKVDSGYSEIEVNLRFREMELGWDDISDSIYAFIDVMNEEGFALVNKKFRLTFSKPSVGTNVKDINVSSEDFSSNNFIEKNMEAIENYPHIYQFKLLFDVY